MRFFALILSLFMLSASAEAQTGIISPGHVLGNGTAAPAAPTDTGLGLILDQALGSTVGSVAVRGSGGWAAGNTFPNTMTFSVNPIFSGCSGYLYGNGSGPATCSTASQNSNCINAAVQYGANGTSGDGARIQNAINAANPVNGGPGCVFFPALGKAYIIDAGINTPNGMALYGDGSMNFNGLTETVAQWAQYGTWFQCTDASNPCITLSGHGGRISGINLIWNQVVPPTTGTYTPTIFPDGVYITGTFFRLEHMLMVGGTRCININYTSGSGGGTYSRIDDMALGCLGRGILATNVNDTLYMTNIDARPLWYMSGYPPLVTYLENSLIGIEFAYADNPSVKNYECFQCFAAMKFSNSTVSSNTHALYNGQLDGIQCNLDRICMLAGSGVVASFSASNVLAQQDTSNSLSDTLFQFNTDNIDATFGNLDVITTGGELMNIGAGANGQVKIGNLKLGTKVDGSAINGYSTVASGQVAFSMGSGAKLSIANHNVVRGGSYGAFVGGAGASNLQMTTYCWQPTNLYGQITLTGTGSAASWSTNNYFSTTYAGNFLQVRIIGDINVTTTSSGGTAKIYDQSFPTAYIQASTSSGGWQTNLDSNWVDVTDTGVGLGAMVQNTTNGATIVPGGITFCGR